MSSPPPGVRLGSRPCDFRGPWQASDAAGLLVTGCGSDDSSGGDGEKAENAESAASQKKLPVPVKSVDPAVHDTSDDPLEISSKPGSSADFEEQVEHKLRETLLHSAKVEGETSAACPKGVTPKAGAVSKCTVMYEGAEIPFEVKVSDSYRERSAVMSYQSIPQKSLLVEKSGHAALKKWGGEREQHPAAAR